MLTYLGLFFPTCFLLIITFLFVVRGRIFTIRVRKDFYAIFLFIVFNLFACYYIDAGAVPSAQSHTALLLIRCLFHPIIVYMWLDILLRDVERPKWYKCLSVPLLISTIHVILSLVHFHEYSEKYLTLFGFSMILSAILYIVFSAFLIRSSSARSKKHNSAEMMIMCLMLFAMLVAIIIELFYSRVFCMDYMIAIDVCVYAYYIQIQRYKRDALTHLMTRHDLMCELEERKQEEFWVSLIDVDNFKKINDKYGHDKGDEALVLVVDVLRKYFNNDGRVYRYGGDEFVILSFGIGKEELEALFVKANDELAKEDRHISYGFIQHKALDDAQDLLKQADVFMYENKRQNKMEDIWDDMTGAYNLQGFLEELEVMRKRAYAEKQAVLLGTFDIEHLGNINTEYGFSEGNLVIKAFADILQNSLDVNSLAGHMGGDQFVVAIKTDPGYFEEMDSLIERIQSGILNYSFFDEKVYTVEFSEAHDFMDDKEQSCEKEVNRIVNLNEADKENRRKNTYGGHNPFEQQNKEETELALSIIDGNKFKYALQPIVNAKDGEIVAYEALMRSDTEPAISPLTLLRHAKKQNRSYDIERCTFFNVLSLFRDIKEELGDRQIFLNSIPGHLLNEDDYEQLRYEYGDLLKRVVVEITEQSELSDEELELIKKRQEQDGNGIAIDDYGSGASNTYNLLRIRPGIIKLDRLLISDIDCNTKKQYFVNSIVTFAKGNGIRVLAEGVETEAEMKMIIRLHVDYIQGFYVGRPSFEPIKKIDESISKAIISENIRGVVEGKRKIYLAANENYLSLVQLALEEYTGITVSSPKLTLVGNRDYEADMCIKIKDGAECMLVLRDVRLTSVDQLPCIDLGEDSHLTLVLEGECTVNHRGIHVPAGSSLEVLGSGKLEVSTKGHDCFGIGAGYGDEVGDIRFNHSGTVNIRVDGEESIALGGGIYSGGKGIEIVSGVMEVSVASVNGIGIGCVKGDVPIQIRDCRLKMDIRVNEGCGIGTIYGTQNIALSGFALDLVGSGSKVSGIGTITPSGGTIRFTEGSVIGGMSGQEIYLIGIPEGELEILGKNARIEIKGEGNNVLAIGSGDYASKVDFREVTTDIIINSSVPIAFGTEKENLHIHGIEPTLHINE